MLRRALTPLLLTAAVAVPAVAAPAAQAAPSSAACASAHVFPSPEAIQRARAVTLCLINRERAARGLRRLRPNSRLGVAATRHSRDMVRRAYFSHDTAGGGSFVRRVLSARYVSRRAAWSLGENIAWGAGRLASPAATVDAWMRSPGHRANILSRSFREIGVGIAPGTPRRGVGPGAVYTTDFGRRG
jgi:uncharacterized protein YkwD